MKTQDIRIADVLVIGPLMVWGGMKLRDEYPAQGVLLALFGVGTVIYNADNYFKRRAEQTGR